MELAHPRQDAVYGTFTGGFQLTLEHVVVRGIERADGGHVDLARQQIGHQRVVVVDRQLDQEAVDLRSAPDVAVERFGFHLGSLDSVCQSVRAQAHPFQRPE